MAKIKTGNVFTSSPVIKRLETVEENNLSLHSFSDALKMVLGGKNVTKLSWSNPQTYMLMVDDYLCICINGKISQLILHKLDIEGDDWYSLPLKN